MDHFGADFALWVAEMPEQPGPRGEFVQLVKDSLRDDPTVDEACAPVRMRAHGMVRLEGEKLIGEFRSLEK